MTIDKFKLKIITIAKELKRNKEFAVGGLLNSTQRTEEPEGHTLKICPLETECVTVKYLEQCLVQWLWLWLWNTKLINT